MLTETEKELIDKLADLACAIDHIVRNSCHTQKPGNARSVPLDLLDNAKSLSREAWDIIGKITLYNESSTDAD